MKPIMEWVITLIVVISEWIHGKRTERRAKRALHNGGEPHVHLQ